MSIATSVTPKSSVREKVKAVREREYSLIRYFIIRGGEILFQTDDAKAALEERMKHPGAIITGRIWTDLGGVDAGEKMPPYPESNPVAHEISCLSYRLTKKITKAMDQLPGYVNSLGNSGLRDRVRVKDESKQHEQRTATNQESAELFLSFKLLGWFDMTGDLCEQFESWLRRTAEQMVDCADRISEISDDRNIDLIREFVHDKNALQNFMASGKDIQFDGTIITRCRLAKERADRRELINRLSGIGKTMEEMESTISEGRPLCYGVIKADDVLCVTTDLSRATGFAQGQNHNSIVVGLVDAVKVGDA